MYQVLDHFHSVFGVDILIEGEQRGADLMAKDWAISRGIPVDPYPAQWEKYGGRRKGNPAGPIRNQRMLDEGQPEYVIAFHRNPSASKGSKHMVTIAGKAGIPYVWLPSGERSLTLFEGNNAGQEQINWHPGSTAS